MKNNQNFIVDLYWYEDYTGEKLTPDFLNNGEYLDCDAEINGLADYIKELEENWTLTTELFIKLRVLRDNPIFKHLAKGGKIKIEMI